MAALRAAGYDEYIPREKEDIESENPVFKNDGEGARDRSFDYLLNMSFLQCTQEQVRKVEKDLELKVTKLEKLRQTSAVEMWKSELHTLREALSQNPEYRMDSPNGEEENKIQL